MADKEITQFANPGSPLVTTYIGSTRVNPVIWEPPTARDYIQDGLVAMWDGIENAGWGTHDSSATVWVDLLGGEGFSFAVAPSWDADALVCTQQADATAQGVTSRSVNQMHGEYVFRVDRMINTSGEVAIVTDNTSNKDLYGIFQATVAWPYFTNKGRRIASVIRLGILTTPVSISVQYPADAVTAQNINDYAAYYNTNTIPLDSSSYQIGTHDYLRINGGRLSGNGSFVGRFYCIRLYSRALTAAEVAANYAIDKIRFGL